MKVYKTIVYILMGLIGVVGGYFIFQWSFISWENNQKALANEKILSTRGIKTTAKIINYKQLFGNGGKPSLDDEGNQRYDIDYQFEVEGKTYTGKTYEGRKNPRDPVEIVYEPQLPENNRSPAQIPTFHISYWNFLPILTAFFVFLSVLSQILLKPFRFFVE
jgi:hypothetical protein